MVKCYYAFQSGFWMNIVRRVIEEHKVGHRVDPYH